MNRNAIFYQSGQHSATAPAVTNDDLSSMSVGRSSLASKIAATTGIALLAGTLASQGLEFTDAAAQYNNSKTLSADPMYRWSAAVQRTDPTLGTTYASAVMIAPDVFITAGHVTPRDNSLTASLNEIVFGANYNTSPDRYNVDHTQRYPGYVFGNTSTIDLGVGWTTSFVQNFTPVTFASAAVGQQLTAVGYGNYGDSQIGELPSIGDRLAGYAPVQSFTSSSYPSTYYKSLLFGGNPAIDGPLNVSGMNYDSGAPWYNSSGNLSLLTIAGTIGLGPGYTTALDLTNPQVQSYLQPIIADSWARYYASVPEPTTAAIAALGGAALIAARRRRE